MILLQNVKGVKTLRWYWQWCSDLLTRPFTPPLPSPISVPDPGPDRHAGGAGDLLRAAAAQAAEEDVLREEGEAAGPPGHPGARPPVLHHRVQEVPERRQGPPFRQLHHSGHPQRRPHGRLGRPRRAVGGGWRGMWKRSAARVSTSGNPNISNFSRQTSWDSSIQQAVSF